MIPHGLRIYVLVAMVVWGVFFIYEGWGLWALIFVEVVTRTLEGIARLVG